MLKLPKSKTNPLRLFYKDWQRTMDFIYNQNKFYTRFYTNGLLNPKKLEVKKVNDKIFQIEGLEAGVIYNGNIYYKDELIQHDISRDNVNYDEGHYRVYLKIEEIEEEEQYIEDPFQPKHIYKEYKVMLSLERVLGYAYERYTYNKDKIYICFLGIDSNMNIGWIGIESNNQQESILKTVDKRHRIGEFVYQSSNEFAPWIKICEGQTLDTEDYPQLYYKVGSKYGNPTISDYTSMTFEYVPRLGAYIKTPDDLEDKRGYPFFCILAPAIRYFICITKKLEDGMYQFEPVNMTESEKENVKKAYTSQRIEDVIINYFPLGEVVTIVGCIFFKLPDFKSKSNEMHIGIITDDIEKYV